MLKARSIIRNVDSANFEIKIAREMNSPYLLNVNYVTRERNCVFISMPFAERGDL